MRNQKGRALAEIHEDREENRLQDMVVGLTVLLEKICSSQVKTWKRVLDARDIPREVKDVLSDRVRSHERDLQNLRRFLAEIEMEKQPE